MADRKAVVIGSGQSLNADDLAKVRAARYSGHIKFVIVANNAYKVAPWADFLVSADKPWWNEYKPDFKGGKFAPMGVKGAIRFVPHDYQAGCNSGLYGCYLARELGADEIILLGFDMHGSHFHGNHENLKNPKGKDFDGYKAQFALFEGCAIINATKGSALDCFPFMDLADAITHRADIC